MAAQKAFAYLRVSSVGQVDGHGFDRQRDTIAAAARRMGYTIVHEYTDAYTGTDADRPGFTDMVSDILANGVRTVLIESLDRLARSLSVQIALLARLKAEGIALINATTGENVTAETDELREAMTQIQGVFAELEKKRLVKKLRKAREAVRATAGKCEGRKAYGERPGEAETVRTIFAKRRVSDGQRKSYAKIAAELNAEGRPTRTGSPWRASTVQNILERGRVKFSA